MKDVGMFLCIYCTLHAHCYPYFLCLFNTATPSCWKMCFIVYMHMHSDSVTLGSTCTCVILTPCIKGTTLQVEIYMSARALTRDVLIGTLLLRKASLLLENGDTKFNYVNHAQI